MHTLRGFRREEASAGVGASALLTLLGFLFAGFALIAVNRADKDRADYRFELTVLLAILVVVGFASPLLFHGSLDAAEQQVQACCCKAEGVKEPPSRPKKPCPPPGSDERPR